MEYPEGLLSLENERFAQLDLGGAGPDRVLVKGLGELRNGLLLFRDELEFLPFREAVEESGALQ